MITIKYTAAITAIISAVFTTSGHASSQASSFDKLEGIWKSVGYGKIVEFKGGHYQEYHITDISCVKGEAFPPEYVSHAVNRIDATEDNKLSHYLRGGINRYDYTRLSALPVECLNKPNKDPEYNFEVFWHAFNDNYAFFDVRGVDWQATYEKYRPLITQNTTDKELFKILSDTLAPLKDGHVNLIRSEDEYFKAGVLRTLSNLIKEPTYKGIPHVYEAESATIIKDIITKYYLKNTKKSAIAGGMFTWGWAADGIGYISIDEMEGYVPEEAPGRERRAVVDRIMDRIITDLEGAKGFIVDARWNGGGDDESALAIAGRFTDQELFAFSKETKVGTGFAPKQRIFIPNYAEKVYTGPVAYLHGSDTFSAAEIFSMAMQAIPNVTTIGENTGGSLSDMLGFVLPNEWQMTMSNQMYVASDGNKYESFGIPSDITVLPQKDDTLETYIVRGMDTAISFLEKK